MTWVRHLRRYTEDGMKKVVQPVALAVILLVAGLPVASLACQLTCATQETSAHLGHGHHHQSAAAATSDAPAETSRVSTSGAVCDLGLATVSSTVTDTLVAFAPVAARMAATSFGGANEGRLLAADRTHSPPGVPPGTFALRI
jgi:hypothetical protein